MSEDNEKDSQNTPYFDPLYSPNELEEKEKSVEEHLAEQMERYNKELMRSVLSSRIGNPHLIETPLLTPDASTPLLASAYSIPDVNTAKIIFLESEINRLNSDIIQLKNMILILKTELQDLKNHKED